MYSKRFSTVIAMIALFCVFEAQSQQPEENPKPSSCDGVLTVQAEIPEILGVDGKPFNQFVGNLTYSLTMDGAFSLNSTTSTWHCNTINTRSNSTNIMRTLKNVYGSVQTTCNAEVQDVQSTWVTQWTKATFAGQLYVSVIAHDGICGSPATILPAGTTCNYDVVTDGGLKGHGECRWKTIDYPHHLGDNQEGDNGGQ
ncbi:hypothetical protein PCANC_07472 [Puccinia coronata f. sp. avenae]|uniref:AA1-like domain-containing protein n=1 Tax=Puccinia coronata f. sp. avenae TaxID=200324 RepID=A0A2N5TLP4_9BASI|nr:hypothetical protein PCASD_15910 [Puccinia coronata f. sp. avenae]PLW26308.1 hypothetical protein PCANC_23794 [Puccinia coronata f. sp. avenae]PLW48838.1 hypothetical protein PCASD_02837 [Puccinia coronata f. sp. avenae]PLW53233.1 hypothetical protein PCANC_07472 [Puccinia coronata f. sp. avenae]